MVHLIGNPLSRKQEEGKEQLSDGETNVHIYDARPYLNAIANKVSGKGFENTSYYRNAKIFFMDIPNIHTIRDSYKKLISVISK